MMSERPAWLRNEYQQINTDFSDPSVVQRYEQCMGEFRNLAAEDAAILDLVSLPAGSHILEIGTGTGHFALAAARAGHHVTAADVSPPMLRYAEDRAKAEGVAGIQFCHGGFLTFDAAPGTFDAAVSVAVLHHLPDLWKAVALRKIRCALRPGGRFVLRDVVFFTLDGDPRPQFDPFLAAMPPSMRDRAAGHIADEFSTLDWIMEGLLTRAGFTVESIDNAQAPMIQYLCKTADCGAIS
jgi:putative AdoMet-dependent methyltransferase